MHLYWITLASNPCELDNSTGRAVDRYPEGASPSSARVNIFQLTSALSDYHETFLLGKLAALMILISVFLCINSTYLLYCSNLEQLYIETS